MFLPTSQTSAGAFATAITASARTVSSGSFPRRTPTCRRACSTPMDRKRKFPATAPAAWPRIFVRSRSGAGQRDVRHPHRRRSQDLHADSAATNPATNSKPPWASRRSEMNFPSSWPLREVRGIPVSMGNPHYVMFVKEFSPTWQSRSGGNRASTALQAGN